MLDDDQGVAGLFQDGHELKDCEGSEDLQLPMTLDLRLARIL